MVQYENLIQLCNFIIINRGTGETELNEKLKYLENDTATQNLKETNSTCIKRHYFQFLPQKSALPHAEGNH